ncbi:MAG: hypothetical protein MUF38_13060 [Anaerolineae bacterium]|jgi:hypothetical protein|nr:hypothetical protein [Anaerolineae bacterium]
MSHKIVNDPQKPIVIAKFTEPFNAVEDSDAVAAHLNKFLAKHPGIVHYIADMSKINIDFSQLIIGMAAAYKTPNSPYSNPRLKIYSIANDELIILGTQASAEQEQYGKVDVRLYPDQEAALAEINAYLAQEG